MWKYALAGKPSVRFGPNYYKQRCRHWRTTYSTICQPSLAEKKCTLHRCICRVPFLAKKGDRRAVQPMPHYYDMDIPAKMRCVNELVVNVIEKCEKWKHSSWLCFRLN